MCSRECLSWAPVLVFSARLCQNKASAERSCQPQTFSKTRVAFLRNPLYPLALDVKRFEQQSPTSLCRGPCQGMVKQTIWSERIHLKFNSRGVLGTQDAEVIQYMERSHKKRTLKLSTGLKAQHVLSVSEDLTVWTRKPTNINLLINELTRLKLVRRLILAIPKDSWEGCSTD